MKKLLPYACRQAAGEEEGEGPVKSTLMDDAASDYEHRISTLGLV